MKVLYLECNMGAAGDMLGAALSEIADEKEKVIEELKDAGIPGVEFSFEKAAKCGINGTHVSVKVNGCEEEPGEEPQEHHHEHHHDHEHEHHHDHEHHHHHEHHSLADISGLIDALNVSEKVRNDAKNVFGIIAEAESRVHGQTIENIHFHEVGSMDAVADVTAACLFMEKIAPDKVIVSPINVGGGNVRCAHGILPVPAPATELILKDIPWYEGRIKSELCTPTGAAILKYFADEFGPKPVMRVKKTGYGFGKKDFDQANCVRAFLGETEGAADTVAELSCNIDDMTGEEIGFAFERLMEAGARDVFIVPVYMKKSRPGSLLKVIVSPDKKDEIVREIFKNTTTLGVRSCVMQRDILVRTESDTETSFGKMRLKNSSGYGISRSKVEYEDIKKAALENDISILDVKEKIR